MMDLVKFLNNVGKKRTLPSLSPAASELLASQVVPSIAYPLELLNELLRVMDELVVRGDENAAMEVGATGGPTFQGVLKAYVKPGDPTASVLAMRHGWRAHYNFGQLIVEEVARGDVLFRLQGYPDVPMVFALMMAGWGVGAARAAGSKAAQLNVLERPWRGAASFVYLIRC